MAQVFTQFWIELVPCHDWLLGKCERGECCPHDHPRGLDSSLYDLNQSRFHISTALGEACANCLQNATPCDKSGRGGEDDPCSECRWFGGEACKCLLATNASYNDELFKQMLGRCRYGYNLARNKNGLAKHGMEGLDPVPMPDNKVIDGWSGESKEQLLARTDMLPQRVRDQPRAYFATPSPTALLAMLGQDSAAIERHGAPQRVAMSATTEDTNELRSAIPSMTLDRGDDDLEDYVPSDEE